jgi:thiol-disulfide isomerase/thioredoxin
MNMKKWTFFLIIGIAMSVLGMTTPALYAESNAPDFQLEVGPGKIITKKSLEGTPTLLMFWASWCGVCRRELPNLKAFYEENKGKSLQILAIGTQDTQSNIAGYVKDHPEVFTFPVAYDKKSTISTAYAVRAFPTFVLLNEKGEIILTHVGGGFLSNPNFQKFIQVL